MKMSVSSEIMLIKIPPSFFLYFWRCRVMSSLFLWQQVIKQQSSGLQKALHSPAAEQPAWFCHGLHLLRNTHNSTRCCFIVISIFLRKRNYWAAVGSKRTYTHLLSRKLYCDRSAHLCCYMILIGTFSCRCLLCSVGLTCNKSQKPKNRTLCSEVINVLLW